MITLGVNTVIILKLSSFKKIQLPLHFMYELTSQITILLKIV